MKFSKTTLLLALFIILSAAVMRPVLNFFYQNLGKKNLELLVSSLFFFTIVIFLYWKTRFSFRWKTLFNFLVLISGFIFAWRMNIIEERVHLLEYGLLGWLATKDSIKAFKSSRVHKFISYPLLFILIIGTLDELFQWWLPTRVGDIRDVVFNTFGGAWGITLKILNNASENVVA